MEFYSKQDIEHLPINADLAFDRVTAQEIGRRERWTCQRCGRKFQDGYMVDMAHKRGVRARANDTNANNGTVLCLMCHAEQHWDEYQQTGDQYHYRSAEMITSRAYNQGLHTQKYYQDNPMAICDDRDEVVDRMRNMGDETAGFNI